MPAKPLDRNALCALCLLALAAIFVGWLRLNFASQYAPATLEKLMAGEAATPFQYRWLIPFVFARIVALTDVDLATLVRSYETLCFAASVLAIAAYGRATGLTPRQAFAAALCYLALIPFFFLIQPLSRLYYPYDSAAVLFCALALLALSKQRRLLFLGIFALGLQNRESIVLLFVLALYLWRGEARSRAFIGFCAAGVALIIASKLVALTLFADNPGAGVLSFDHDIMHRGLPTSLESSRVYSNLMLFAGLDSATLTLSVFGYLWLPIVFFWREIDNDFVRKSLLLIPASFATMFFVGNLNEPRIFCELAPVVLVAVAHITRRQLGPNRLRGPA